MEQEEHSLRRQCEELHLTLESRTRELSQSKELYSKLKQRVLRNQTQEVPPSLLRSRTRIQAIGAADAARAQAHSQLAHPAKPAGVRTAVPNHYSASPGTSKTRQTLSHRKAVHFRTGGRPANKSGTELPARPLSNKHLRNPRSLTLASTPRTGVGTMVSIPGSSPFHQTACSPHTQPTSDIRGLTGAGSSVTLGVSCSLGTGGEDVPKSPLGAIEGSCFCTPIPA
ncbi:hypothetical protein C7999DRAFT_16314 [Corynascus novoguineensis]|uniref:Uncharacterized protein n=1 Tax=Corynascus novoguineensis TaxID=1126955 RepID=A0AAN7CNM5_9PEZI|nr:hypothetical protein C7999DRAFT_16314 [Corynascus novoguineensis]